MTLKLEDGDYYLEESGLMVFTEQYHVKRGYCCKNKCRHCPWDYGRMRAEKNDGPETHHEHKDEKVNE